MKWLPLGKPHPELPFHAANKNRLGEWLVRRLLVLPGFSRAFHAVYAYADLEALRLKQTPDLPVIFCLTHSGWWDGYFASVLNRAIFKQDGYLMMEESSLTRYPFFTWIGVFGVDRDDPRKALASIDYAVKLLTEGERRAVWVFPQGTITHPDTRPLGVFGGVAHIARRVGRCAIVPVALRYEFRLEQAPEAFAYIGPPLVVEMGVDRLSAREITAQVDAIISAADDKLHKQLVDGDLKSYRPILKGRASISRIWDSALAFVSKTLRGQ